MGRSKYVSIESIDQNIRRYLDPLERRWSSATKSHFARVKKIAEMASMATKALATAEQAKLYEWKGAATDESKRACQKWSIIRQYLDNKMVMRDVSFTVNSNRMKERRRVGEHNKRQRVDDKVNDDGACDGGSSIAAVLVSIHTCTGMYSSTSRPPPSKKQLVV